MVRDCGEERVYGGRGIGGWRRGCRGRWGNVGRVYGGRRRSIIYFFGFGFRVWELGAEGEGEGEGEEAFLCFVFSSSIDFFHHNSSASNFS